MGVGAEKKDRLAAVFLICQERCCRDGGPGNKPTDLYQKPAAPRGGGLLRLQKGVRYQKKNSLI